jgi:rhamnose transport system permease protein
MSAAVATGRVAGTLPGLLRSRDVGIGAVVVLVAAAFGLAQPNFFRPDNLFAIVVSIGILLVMAVGQMFVIVTRQIDLSIGSTLGLAAMAMAMVGRDLPGTPLPVLVLVAVLVGAACGAVNGTLVTLAGVPPIIATLGTLAIFRGLVFLVSDNRQVNPSEVPDSVGGLVGTHSIPVPPLLLIAAAVVAAGWYVAARSMPGLRVYAVGSNPEAAAARGLRPKTTSFMVFVAMGCLAGLAGVLYVARYGTVNPADVGLGWELTVISAVVIGGTNIFGGSGTVSGVVLGCLLVGVLSNGLTVIGVSGFWQQAAEGAIILVAVIVDTFVRRRAQNSQSTRKRA